MSVDTVCGVYLLAVGTRDCLTERQKAEEMDRSDPESGIFIPECVQPEEEGTGDGGQVLFRQAQCHKSTGYCWCVDQETGMPIQGTSTHQVMPDCNNIRTQVFKGTTQSQQPMYGRYCF